MRHFILHLQNNVKYTEQQQFFLLILMEVFDVNFVSLWHTF